jgi:dipeptidase D
VVIIPKDQVADAKKWFVDVAASLVSEYQTTESDLKLKIEPHQAPEQVLITDLQDRLLNALYACPHGVMEMST